MPVTAARPIGCRYLSGNKPTLRADDHPPLLRSRPLVTNGHDSRPLVTNGHDSRPLVTVRRCGIVPAYVHILDFIEFMRHDVFIGKHANDIFLTQTDQMALKIFHLAGCHVNPHAAVKRLAMKPDNTCGKQAVAPLQYLSYIPGLIIGKSGPFSRVRQQFPGVYQDRRDNKRQYGGYNDIVKRKLKIHIFPLRYGYYIYRQKPLTVLI